MSHSKGRVLSEQKKKIAAVGKALGWPKALHWKSGLNISGATFSNWTEGRSISTENISAIASTISKALSISFVEKDMDLPISEFCAKLSVVLEDPNDFDVLRFFYKRPIQENDVGIMNRLRGRHSLLFLGRDGKETEVEYLAIEQVEIGGYAVKELACPIRQIKNQITNSSPSGWLRSTNERVVFALSYAEYYPESLYFSIPVFDADVICLYGFYVDVTPISQKEIFSVRFLMVPQISDLSVVKKIFLNKGDEIFMRNKEALLKCMELLKLENIDPNRKRMVIGDERGTTELVKDVVKRLLKK